MDTCDPVGLLFGGMEQLGPGGNAHTLHVLRLLPKQQFRVVVDVGCGTGRQTLALARELSWLGGPAPEEVREFFRSGYPDMQSVQHNRAVAERAGYKVLTTYTLPRQAWVDGYYDILAPRAQALLDHPDAAVRAFAAET